MIIIQLCEHIIVYYIMINIYVIMNYIYNYKDIFWEYNNFQLIIIFYFVSVQTNGQTGIK